MSMSQEEIEALMSGLDIEDDGDSDEETVTVNTQEIEELLSQTEDFKEDIKHKIEKQDFKEELIEVKSNSNNVSNSDIEKLLNEIESVGESSHENELELNFKSLELDDLKKEIPVENIKPNRSEDE